MANGRLALGHRRLSIIDLTDDGRQPMVSANKRFTITYNGEIYNYKELRKELQDQGHVFSTQSDTEVLLAAWQHWGEACLKRLVGMFAFVIFDKDDEKLYCVRDAFGIKPFFYNLNNGLNFASDMNAIRLIMTGDVHLNYQSIYDYLAYGLYDTGNTTFLDDVEQLLPSELMVYDLNKARIVEKKKWWAPKTDRRDVGFEQAAKEFREVLIKTVRLHMRSDVPIGVALSGGWIVQSLPVLCAILTLIWTFIALVMLQRAIKIMKKNGLILLINISAQLPIKSKPGVKGFKQIMKTLSMPMPSHLQIPRFMHNIKSPKV